MSSATASVATQPRGAGTDYRPWPTAAPGWRRSQGRPPDNAPGPKTERVAAIDSARGLAIALVMLSHFAMRFATEAGMEGMLRWPVIVGMIASPTFILLSGAVYGTLSCSPGTNVGRLRNILFDRGLFLIVVAHPLLGASNLLRATPGAWHHLYITDALAPALLFGPAVAGRTRPATRVILGCALILASWMVLGLSTLDVLAPDVRSLGVIVREALVGTLQHGGETWWGYHWPLAEWFGVYLIGTAVGESLASRPASPWKESRSRWMLRVGVLSATAGAALNLCLLAAVRSDLVNRAMMPIASRFGSVQSKFPPSPAYLLWFGGIGLVLIALMYADIQAGWHTLLSRVTRPMGRSSLVLFIASDYLFHVPFIFWHPRGLGWWFPAFVMTLLPLYWIATIWAGANGNRFLTVGYPYKGLALWWRRSIGRSKSARRRYRLVSNAATGAIARAR